jgi:hypothetical protein
MAAQMLRASSTISAPILAKFNAAVPLGDRSREVQRYMELALQARENQLEQIAADFMSDPANAEVLAEETAWDNTVADGLQRQSTCARQCQRAIRR